MFPEAPSKSMVVVTVTQKTENDMTRWCEEVDEEREQLLSKVSQTLNLRLCIVVTLFKLNTYNFVYKLSMFNRA